MGGRGCRTYCPPGSGEVGGLGERCCLKGGVPAERSSPHWTGLPPRATDPTHSKLSAQCTPKPPPPPGPMPYPGPNFTHPRIHQSPDCLHENGWHDMAGALTYKGWHHAFQGCPNSGGWSHSASQDLVCHSPPPLTRQSYLFSPRREHKKKPSYSWSALCCPNMIRATPTRAHAFH